MKTTLHKAAAVLPNLLRAKIVPFLHSSPGIGKSSIAYQFAKQNKLVFIDIRLSDHDPSDLNGLPSFQDGRAKFIPFDTFPLEDEEIPDGFNGWCIMLDEFNSASPATQAAAYKLVLDRKVGNHKLHNNVVMIAAGNLETDNAIVNPMSSALISRFAHFYIELDNDEWQSWAVKAKVDPRITSFLNFKTSALYTFDPDADTPYGCPRTWEKLSDVIKPMNDVTSTDTVMIASLVGEGNAREFISYLKYFSRLPTFESIVNNPETTKLDDAIGTQWAVMGMIASKVDESNISSVCTYLRRMSLEMQVCALREIKGREPKLLANPDVRQWQLALGRDVFL